MANCNKHRRPYFPICLPLFPYAPPPPERHGLEVGGGAADVRDVGARAGDYQGGSRHRQRRRGAFHVGYTRNVDPPDLQLQT